jgi:ATPase subunit of ABC transporter with duplicated ATPase domains
MSLITAKNLSKSYGTQTVLTDISFSLEKGQKIALVGANGTGKTTLLRILAGLESSDSGELNTPQDVQIGYLPQENRFNDTQTIASFLAHVSETDKQHLHILLQGFGLTDLDVETEANTLSSGQRSKLVLVHLLLKKVSVLLLDEPTNNIDLPALIWLEDFLKKSDIACIVVSHDRRFLDAIADKIAVIDAETRTITISGGRYSDYIEQAKKDLRRKKELYTEQQEEISRLENLVRQKKADALAGSKWEGSDTDYFLRGFKRDRSRKSAKTARVVEKRLNKIEELERPEEPIPLMINLAANTESGSQEITLTNVVAGYIEHNFALEPISLEIRYGNRIGIIGLNGSGKSTLLKTIIGTLPVLAGEVSIGSGLRIGNLLQEHESLPREEIVVDYFMQKTGLTEPLAFSTLSKYALYEWQLRQPISVLSPGGRARLLFAVFATQGINVLVLDEPTNHLDIEAQEALEELLEIYIGTVILVSHDRYFLEKANIDYLYLLENKKLTKIENYTDYIVQAEKKAEQLLKKW